MSEANGESNEKRCKSTESNGNENGFVKAEEDAKLGSNGNAGDEKQNKTKPPEPHKDYIHVRARRGQATDSHSLAERVRIIIHFSQFKTFKNHPLSFFH